MVLVSAFHLWIFSAFFLAILSKKKKKKIIFAGAKTEGILRQAADVDDVNHRIREYEQGLKHSIYMISLHCEFILNM